MYLCLHFCLLQVMVTNVTSLLKTVKAVEDEATRGTRALEATIEYIKQELTVQSRITICGCFLKQALTLKPGSPGIPPQALFYCLAVHWIQFGALYLLQVISETKITMPLQPIYFQMLTVSTLRFEVLLSCAYLEATAASLFFSY